MQDVVFVNIPVEDTVRVLHAAVVNGSFTGELVADYSPSRRDDRQCRVVVYEKYFMRTGGRMTLTAVVDDFDIATRVYLIPGGGGDGGALINFDWGASESFEQTALDALRPYIAKGL